MQSKRGAVELSITTIVVVVIGVTLLVLGLTFVYNIFGGLGEQQRKLGEFTDEQIRDIFAQSDQFLNLPSTELTTKMGETTNLDIVVKNQAQGVNDCTFELNLITDGGTFDPKAWFSFSPYGLNRDFKVIKATPLKIRASIKPTRTNAQLGDYTVTLQLRAKSACETYTTLDVIDQQPVTLSVIS